MNREPIDDVYWINRSQVLPNEYNPNAVAAPEMDLLEHSINLIGFVFPVLLMDNGQPIAYTENSKGQRVVDTGTSYKIIDGFHRFTIAGRESLQKKYNNFIPVVFIAKGNVQMVTVMMNRAKGVHAVVSMSKIVVNLLAQGVPVDKIQQGMGMDRDEIIRLAQTEGITKDKIFETTEFSQAWTPK